MIAHTGKTFMASGTFRTSVLIILTYMGWGCGFSERPLTELPQNAVFLYVPIVPQAHKNDCGPAALASVLAYHGQSPSLDEITRNIFTPVLGRTLLPDMENYARELGFATLAERGDPTLIRKRITAGSPVVLLVDMGWGGLSQGHYVVVFGYTDDGFLMHLGIQENVLMPTRELLRRWARMNNLYLVVE